MRAKLVEDTKFTHLKPKTEKQLETAIIDSLVGMDISSTLHHDVFNFITSLNKIGITYGIRESDNSFWLNDKDVEYSDSYDINKYSINSLSIRY